MPKRLAGILICFLLAYAASYALSRWLDVGIAKWAAPEATVDGSTLNTSRYLIQGGLVPEGDNQIRLYNFYKYLDEGGSAAYHQWKSAPEVQGNEQLINQSLELAEQTNTVKYLSILLLVITLLLRFGGGLKESRWLTPLLYFAIHLATFWLVGGMISPLTTTVIIGAWTLYFVSVRLIFPMYHSEWSRMMQPSLTLCIFLLIVMSIRGQELLDYWFWTSQLYRLLFLAILFMAIYFHFSIVAQVLSKSSMEGIARLFAFGMPVGLTASILGLFMGFYGPDENYSIVQINYEWAILPVDVLSNINPDSPFVLLLIGLIMLILGGIGYFIQRMA